MQLTEKTVVLSSIIFPIEEQISNAHSVHFMD